MVEKGFLEGVSKEIVDEFNNALAVAKNINNNSNSNQEDISKASIDLRNSIKKVMEFERVNKDELRQYVGDIENIDLSVYTESTVAEFTKALKNARDVLNNELATQEEVDKALSDLKVTKGSLTKKRKILIKRMENQKNQAVLIVIVVIVWILLKQEMFHQ